ncbi:MAG TPA: hypothetical protein VGH28_18895 [Polyangiaceae bacterium]|jgi:CheY-like chemotaxis protein
MSSQESFTDEPVTAGNRPRVVVVDDDDEVRRAIANALRKDGYDVVEKKSRGDTLALFGDDVRAPDAVVGGDVAILVGLRERGWATPMVLRGARAAEGASWAPDAILDDPRDLEALRRIMLDLLWPRRTLPSL